MGILGYDPTTKLHYEFAAYPHDPNPIFLMGRAREPGRAVAFDPAPTLLGLARPGIFTSSELRFIDADSFDWVSEDGSWRVVFTRVSHS